MSKKSHHRPFKLPIAIHFFASLVFVTLLTGILIWFSSNYIMRSYIASECEKRIANAVSSCQTFAKAFRNSLPSEEIYDEELIRTYLLNSIVSSTDLSNEASIVLFEETDNKDNRFSVMWPTATYSVSARNRADYYLNSIYENISKSNSLREGDVNSTVVNGNLVYYKFLNVEYSSHAGEDQTEYDEYYLLIYIDTSSYYSFTSSINIAIFRNIIIAVLISTLISIMIAFPLFISSRKLSKFANRVGKGDFTPLDGKITSSEFSDISISMNAMAKKLEQSDQEQKTFFQNASHELRTPLMSIQGYAEGIKYDVFDDEDKSNAVDVIIGETTRLSNLVENLLSISKMDMSKSGTYDVKKTVVDVHEIIDRTIDTVRGGFLLEGKELITDIKVNNTYIHANENDVLRMLENIFSNCLRYANKSVYYKVSTKRNTVIFEISDDGPGISQEVLDNLFERFAKGSDGKHGIGLSLAKAIAQEHNGSIEAYNNDTGGAHFIITLPTIKPREQLSHKNNEG